MDTQTIPSADPKPARAASRPLPVESKEDVVIDCNINELYYGTFKAVRDTRIPIKKNTITAFIGPSGCGKSTVLRCLNRMNDLVRGFRFKGHASIAARTSMSRRLTPSPYGVTSAWCSNNRIPLRPASSITLRSDSGSINSRVTRPRRLSRP